MDKLALSEVARDGAGAASLGSLVSTYAHDFSVSRSLVGLFNECFDSGIGAEILVGEEQLDVSEVGGHSAVSSSP